MLKYNEINTDLNDVKIHKTKKNVSDPILRLLSTLETLERRDV